MLEQVAPLFAGYTQATRLLRLTTPLGAEQLLAECVRGDETISEGYTFTISEPRPFHGHPTAVELNGANGGIARYTLTLQPWNAFLARSRDSRVFQDMNVFDILDAVFSAWQGRGKLAPAWRFDIAARPSRRPIDRRAAAAPCTSTDGTRSCGAPGRH